MVVVRIVVAASSCPPLLPLFGPCLWARRGWGCLVARPPVLAPFLVCGAGGPWPSLVAVLRPFGGWVPGLGGVGVVSAH